MQVQKQRSYVAKQDSRLDNRSDSRSGNVSDRDQTVKPHRSTLRQGAHLFNWRLSQRWKIHQKIGFGYLMAIIVGVVGSATGVVVADYYQGQAVFQLDDAHRQSHILGELRDYILKMQVYSARLPAVLVEPEALRSQRLKFMTSLSAAYEHQQALETFLNEDPLWLCAPQDELQEFLTTSEIGITTYADRIEESLLPTDPLLWDEQDINLMRDRLIAITISQESSNLDEILLHTEQLLEVAQAQEDDADVILETIQGLEKLIIASSLILSMAIAGLIALRTTQTITQPLLSVANVAQKAAQDSNFDLRAPVTTQDEVGILATSLNQLIQRVSERTDELQRALATSELRTIQLQDTVEALQSTQSQLIQTEKMSTLGQLVAGVAHEINNPVNFIHGNITHAKTYLEDLLELIHLYQQKPLSNDPEIQALIDEIDLDFIEQDLPALLGSIKLGTDRICDIVKSLRTFSRLDEAAMKEVDIHEGIESTLLILSNRIKAKPSRAAIELVKDYGDLPLIECYAGQLNQVFMNILSNAIDALDERWTQDQTGSERSPDLSTTMPDSDDHPVIRITTQLINREAIAIHIQDNAGGMTEQVRDRIFEPFFTTKPAGKGTGLGMSISSQIITQKHHGHLRCQSTPRHGTEFVIELPTLQPLGHHEI